MRRLLTINLLLGFVLALLVPPAAHADLVDDIVQAANNLTDRDLPLAERMATLQWLDTNRQADWYRAWEMDPTRLGPAVERLALWWVEGVRQEFTEAGQVNTNPDPLAQIESKRTLTTMLNLFLFLYDVDIARRPLESIVDSWIWFETLPSPYGSEPKPNRRAMLNRIDSLYQRIIKNSANLGVRTGNHLFLQLQATGRIMVENSFSAHFPATPLGRIAAGTAQAAFSLRHHIVGVLSNGGTTPADMEIALEMLYRSGFIEAVVREALDPLVALTHFIDWYRFLDKYQADPGIQRSRNAFNALVGESFLERHARLPIDPSHLLLPIFGEMLNQASSEAESVIRFNLRHHASSAVDYFEQQTERAITSRLETVQALTSEAIIRLEPGSRAETELYVAKLAVELIHYTCSLPEHRMRTAAINAIHLSYGSRFMRDAFVTALDMVPQPHRDQPRYEELRNYVNWMVRETPTTAPRDLSTITFPSHRLEELRQPSERLRQRLEPALGGKRSGR